MSLPLPHAPNLRERRVARTVGAISASVVMLPFVGGTAEAASVPYPKPSQPLPNALDVVTPYQKGYRCLTETQPGVLAFAKLLNATYGSHTYGTLRSCVQEHGEGRALDWMLNANDPAQRALGDALTRWLSAKDSSGRPGAMARRFGINYIIWNRQQWNAWDPGMAWRPYYGSSPHTDHIHFSFTWDGAYARTSWWTGKALTSYLSGPLSTTPAAPSATTKSGYPYLAQGSSGADVVTLQKVIGAEPDGRFGPLTAAALGTWQGKNGLKATKAADDATWAKMIALGKVPAKGSTGGSSTSGSTSGSTTTSSSSNPLAKYAGVTLKLWSRGDAVKAMQRAIGGLSVDGSFGPLTLARVKAYQKSKGLAVTGVVDSRTWKALMGGTTASSTKTTTTTTPKTTTPSSSSTSSPLARYAGITLKLWSRGDAVKAMQKAIGGLTVDGSFGPLTLARVKAYQKSKGLAVTGVVDSATWKALMGGTKSTASGSSGTSGSSSGSSGSSSGSSSSGSSSTGASGELSAYRNTTLRRGARGTAVRVLQKALGGLAVDGSFGPMTEARVKTFQRSARLSVTGVVDRATWDALAAASNPTERYWGVVLRRGSSGDAVKALQRALGGLVVDGRFGPLTEARVKAFQKSVKLTQTGVVGTVTWKALAAR